MLTFRNKIEAQGHTDTGTHQLVLERETVYDTIRRKWAQHAHVTGIVSRSLNPPSRPINLTLTSFSSCSDNNLSLQGWALKGQEKLVKEFLIAKFNEGLLDEKKANPVDVLMEMQDAKELKGLAFFSPEEWKPHSI